MFTLHQKHLEGQKQYIFSRKLHCCCGRTHGVSIVSWEHQNIGGVSGWENLWNVSSLSEHYTVSIIELYHVPGVSVLDAAKIKFWGWKGKHFFCVIIFASVMVLWEMSMSLLMCGSGLFCNLVGSETLSQSILFLEQQPFPLLRASHLYKWWGQIKSITVWCNLYFNIQLS